METIHETIAKEMERVEIDDLHQMLKKKSDVMKSQSIYLRAFLIQATAVYLLSKTSKKKRKLLKSVKKKFRNMN